MERSAGGSGSGPPPDGPGSRHPAPPRRVRRVLGIVQVLGANAVPALGLFVAGWSVGTALLLYWCENLLAIALVALRIALFRRAARKRGRFAGPSGFLRRFLSTALFFTAGHLVFLLVIVFQALPQLAGVPPGVDPRELGRGLAAVALFLGVGFAADLPGIAGRTHRGMQILTERVMGRVIVVHVTIVLGMAAMFWIGSPLGLLAVFIVLKTLVDWSAWATVRNPG